MNSSLVKELRLDQYKDSFGGIMDKLKEIATPYEMATFADNTMGITDKLDSFDPHYLRTSICSGFNEILLETIVAIINFFGDPVTGPDGKPYLDTANLGYFKFLADEIAKEINEITVSLEENTPRPIDSSCQYLVCFYKNVSRCEKALKDHDAPSFFSGSNGIRFFRKENFQEFQGYSSVEEYLADAQATDEQVSKSIAQLRAEGRLPANYREKIPFVESIFLRLNNLYAIGKFYTTISDSDLVQIRNLLKKSLEMVKSGEIEFSASSFTNLGQEALDAIKSQFPEDKRSKLYDMIQDVVLQNSNRIKSDFPELLTELDQNGYMKHVSVFGGFNIMNYLPQIQEFLSKLDRTKMQEQNFLPSMDDLKEKLAAAAAMKQQQSAAASESEEKKSN